jgi:hypothetical protein
MLGVAVVVENLPFLTAAIRSATDHGDGEVVDLSKLPDASRRQLHRLAQEVKHHAHLVVTILSGSLLSQQIEVFRRYDVPVEICMSSCVRTRSMSHTKRDDPNDGTRLDTLQLN